MLRSSVMLLLVVFGLALGAVSPADDHEVKLESGDCPTSWYSFDSRCYKYVPTAMSWADAELNCVSEGANLVSIHSLEEQQFVQSLIKEFDQKEWHTWIGLSDIHKEGKWMWSDGTAVGFEFWRAGQPDNYGGYEHCVLTSYGSDWKWNDWPCSSAYPSVCATRRATCV